MFNLVNWKHPAIHKIREQLHSPRTATPIRQESMADSSTSKPGARILRRSGRIRAMAETAATQAPSKDLQHKTTTYSGRVSKKVRVAKPSQDRNTVIGTKSTGPMSRLRLILQKEIPRVVESSASEERGNRKNTDSGENIGSVVID
jgi:hypothetical protein